MKLLYLNDGSIHRNNVFDGYTKFKWVALNNEDQHE